MKRSPSEQTRKRYRAQQIWSAWIKKTQVAYLYQTKFQDYGQCEKCGKLTSLQADHVIPKSNFRIILNDPLNGQVLDNICNVAKGSIHKDGTDYRSLGMRRFYAKVAGIHWQQYGVKGIWQMTDAGTAWLRSWDLKIPDPKDTR